MKTRVLQLVDSFDEGGSERQALQLTRLLHESGKYEVFLASLKPNGVLRDEIEDLDLAEIQSYPLQSFYDVNAGRQLRRLVRQLRALRIDVLHTHDFYTNVFGMTAGLLARVKVRIASRRETTGLRTSGQEKAQRLAYALAHHVLANSYSVKQKLVEEGLNSNRITVIHNAINADRINSGRTERSVAFSNLHIGDTAAPSDSFVTIVANMRHEVKDYPMFLRAAQRVTNEVPTAKFLLAGEGELRASLEKLSEELKIHDRVIFLGRCANVQELLSLSDVCVLSSKAEGFSNSILEYMAAARPVVATDVGGAREVIAEGETGFLVSSGDDLHMAQRIIQLLKDPVTARAMGEKGQRIINQHFSQQALLDKTENLYTHLLHATSESAARDRSVVTSLEPSN